MAGIARVATAGSSRGMDLEIFLAGSKADDTFIPLSAEVNVEQPFQCAATVIASTCATSMDKSTRSRLQEPELMRAAGFDYRLFV